MPDRTKQAGEHLTVALTDQVRAGPYHVDLPMAPDEINTRLKAIGQWLVDWQMPHQLRLVHDQDQALLCLSFTHAEHAHAFQLTFGGEERIDNPDESGLSDQSGRPGVAIRAGANGKG